jgi:hypothetical protein
VSAGVALTRLAAAAGSLLFYGALLGLLVTLIVMVLGATGGLPTDGRYVGAIHVRAPLILAALAALGFTMRRYARQRVRNRS